MREEKPSGALAGLLAGASRAYGGAMAARERLFAAGLLRQEKVPAKVLSIGNLSLGGTGKTPMAIHAARLLKAAGLRVGVASRGYGGTLSKTGGLVSDGEKILAPAEQAGDEPFLMAQKLPGVPVAVAAERVRAANMLIEVFGAEVVILDDGFQHRRLFRDCDLLLADAKKPLGSGRLFPAGVLREPPGAAARAQGLALTRSDGSEPVPEFWKRHSGGPVFRCSHEPTGFFESPAYAFGNKEEALRLPLSLLSGRPVAAFSAIAGNEGFFRLAASLAGELVFSAGFGDHHEFRPEELEEILAAAKRKGAAALLTTEKDCVRLNGWAPADMPVLALEIGMKFFPGPDLGAFFKERLGL